MTGFRAIDDAGQLTSGLHPEALHHLLASSTVVDIDNPEWGTAHRATAKRRPGVEQWSVTISGTRETVVADLPSTAATYDALRSWAAADGWWREAFTWTPV